MDLWTNNRHRIFHQLAPYGTKSFFEKTDLEHFPARIFEERSENMSWCLWGQNRRIGDQFWRYYVTEKIRKTWIKKRWPSTGADLLNSGAKKLRMMFPHISVLSKHPQLPYGLIFVELFFVFLGFLGMGWCGHASFGAAWPVIGTGTGVWWATAGFELPETKI